MYLFQHLAIIFPFSFSRNLRVVKQTNSTVSSIKRIWSACIGQAAATHALTGAIPLLLAASTLSCWMSPLARIALPQTTWPPWVPPVSMLTPSLVRTLVQRDTQCSRTPVLKPSSKSSLPFAWITGPATDPSL